MSLRASLPRERSAGGIGSPARPTRPRRSACVSRRTARRSRSPVARPSTCRSWTASTASPTRRRERSSRHCAECSPRAPGYTRRPVWATTIATIPPCARRRWRSTRRAPTWRCTPTCLTPPCSGGPGGCSTAGRPRGRIRQASDGRASSKPPASQSSGLVAAAHRLSAEDRAGKLEAVLTYGSQIAPLQRAFGSSLEDPQLLGLEVDWRLSLVA